MSGEHAEVSLSSGDLHLVDLLLDEQPVGGDDLQFDGGG
jgi:hypothetical protein